MPNHRPRLASRTIALALSTIACTCAADAKQSFWSKFDISAGAGAIAHPTYLGSDRYQVSPLPYISLRWNDMVELGPEGLNVYWHHKGLTVGVGLAFDGGRQEKDSDGFSFETGDSRLKGMGKIDAAVGYHAFIKYELGMVELSAGATKYEGSQNKGLVTRFGADVPLHLTTGLTLTPHAEGRWANDSFMQTFFGVTALQATTSRFAEFHARNGVVDFTTGLTLSYQFDKHWFAMGDVSAALLTGDARRSPLSYSKSGTTVATVVGYRF